MLPEEECRKRKLSDIKGKNLKFPIYIVELGFENIKRLSYKIEQTEADNVIFLEVLIEMDHPCPCMK